MAGVRERDSQKMRAVIAARRRVDLTEESPLLQEEDAISVENTVNNSTLSLSRCKTSCARRSVPRGKGLLLLLFVYFMEGFAFYSATKGLRELLFKDDLVQKQTIWGSFLYSLIYNTFGRLFYPLAGILADSFLGRYKVIEIGLWLISCGMFLICISLSITDQVPSYVGGIVLPILCIIFIAVGTACVEVNAVSFGVDQLPQGCTSDQISSFFFWYNFVRNISTLLGVGLAIALFSSNLFLRIDHYLLYKPHLKSVDIHYKALIVLMLATAAIVVGLFFHIVKHHWYFKNTQRENPIKTVVNVTWFSLTVKRHAPIRRRAFRYGEARQPRIELAKIEYDGIFEAETVENVKTFYQILFLIVSLGGFFASNGAVHTMLSSQLEVVTKRFDGEPYHVLSTYLITLINTTTIVVFLPIVNHTILPFFYAFSVSLRVRLGIGQVFNVLAVLIAVLLQGVAEENKDITSTIKLLLLFLPAIILSIGESLTFVTGLEFIYAQAPEPMKGLLTGLFYFMFGISGGVASVVFYFFPTEKPGVVAIMENYNFWFYVTFAAVAILGLLVYILVACLYRNRRRPADDEDDLVRRIYAQNVFSH